MNNENKYDIKKKKQNPITLTKNEKYLEFAKSIHNNSKKKIQNFITKH
jgi:hypothetical protein